MMNTDNHITESALWQDVKQLIDQSRQRVASVVNAEMSMLYWSMGKRIQEDVLKNERAEYGKQVITSLSKRLTDEYGKGWSDKQLRQCIQFAVTFPDNAIVYTLCIQLSWSHIRALMFIEAPLKREFYIEMCKMEHWSVRTLRQRIDSMLYERTAIIRKKTLKRPFLPSYKVSLPNWVMILPFLHGKSELRWIMKIIILIYYFSIADCVVWLP